MTHLRPLVFSFTVALSLSSAPLQGQTSIPNTPAGRALRAWLDAYNSGDSAHVAAFLRTYQLDFAIRNSFHFRQMTGGFDLLRVEVSEPRHIEFFLRHRNDPTVGYGVFEVASDNPTVLSGTAFPLGPSVSPESVRLDARARARVVRRLAALLDAVYVLPEVGNR